VDTRDELRRLLAQRLELGETSIVLGSARAAEIATQAATSGRPPRRSTVPVPSAPPAPAADDGRTDAGPGASGDWRTALQQSGGEPSAVKPDRAKTSNVARPAAAGSSGRPAQIVVTPDASLPPLGSLAEIATAVAGCTRCPLYATALNPVPGEGNPEADFMVIGEAPGATEDETGKPFVGRAGQLLTQILAAIQLTREDVFICNVLKHRPPGNRNPEPDEVRACSPYLIRQIELVRPKVILALGTFSAQTLLDTKISIGKLRGQIHQYHGVPVVVTYHPAALLRNPAWKRPTWEDVQLARRILDSAVPGA
jgi:uracil-DNA glycosylase family 4